MTRRRAVKILSLAIALILFYGFSQMYFWRCNSHNELRLYGFRQEKEDSLDVVLLGASDIYAYSAPLAYSRQGFTSYPYVVSACSVCFWKAMLEDILNHQDPQLIVVETTGACYDTLRELHNNGALHYILDGMPFRLKLKVIRPLLTEENDSAAAFLFPGLKYHSNWQDSGDLKSNFLNVRMLQKQGHAILRGTYTSRFAIGLQSESRHIEDDRSERPLDGEAEQALREFLKTCREMDLPVLFTCFPHQITIEDDEVYQNFQMTNTIEKIVGEYGFPFLNMEGLADEIGIDPEHDYYNRTHLNLYGQQKLTEFLAQYIKTNFNIVPRAQDAEQSRAWEESADYYTRYCRYIEETPTDSEALFSETHELMRELREMKGT